MDKPKFYNCGICDCYHPIEFDGDCREDGSRYALDELDMEFGTWGWEEVDAPQ